MSERVAVRKTYKLFIGGSVPAQRVGTVVSRCSTRNVALASRKDVRDAVVAARAAVAGLGRRDRVQPGSDPLPGRRDAGGPARTSSSRLGVPADEVDAAIDRWVWYAGWSDKIAQVYGGANPVAGPYFNLSAPEPTGVVGVVAPPTPALLGLVSVIAPAIVTGNTVVVLAAEPRPLPAVTLAEVLATSDLPGGVVNLLTGRAPRPRRGWPRTWTSTRST